MTLTQFLAGVAASSRASPSSSDDTTQGRGEEDRRQLPKEKFAVMIGLQLQGGSAPRRPKSFAIKVGSSGYPTGLQDSYSNSSAAGGIFQKCATKDCPRGLNPPCMHVFLPQNESYLIVKSNQQTCGRY